MNKKQINVLHVVGGMNMGGAETMIMNIYRNVKNDNLKFSFLSHIKEECAYDNEILTNGNKIIHIDPLGTLGLFRYVYRLKKLLKNNIHFDSIHIHTNYQAGAVLIAAKLAGIKQRIVHSHSSNWSKKSNIVNKVILLILKISIYFLATTKLSCSREAAHFLYFKKDKGVQIIKNGIDLDRFKIKNVDKELELRKKYKISGDYLIIGHIGRFEKVKNHDYILEIVESMSSVDIKFKFLLIGVGKDLDRIKEKAYKMKLENFIIFVGEVSNTEDYYNLMDVFILPSLYEGIPLTLVEAQISGVRCIVSSTITDDSDFQLGLLKFIDIDKKNVSDWKNEILYPSIDNQDKTFNERHKIITKKGYNVKKNIEKIEALYEER